MLFCLLVYYEIVVDHWRAPLTPSPQEVLLLCFGGKRVQFCGDEIKRRVIIESSRVVCVYLHIGDP